MRAGVRAIFLFLMISLTSVGVHAENTSSCWGTDGNLSIYAKGAIIARTGNVFSNWCETQTTIINWQCDASNGLTITTIECPEGYHCGDGVCVPNAVYSEDGSHIVGAGDTISAGGGGGGGGTVDNISENGVTLNVSGKLVGPLHAGDKLNLSTSGGCYSELSVNSIGANVFVANLSVESVCPENKSVSVSSPKNSSTENVNNIPAGNADNSGKIKILVAILLAVIIIIALLKRGKTNAATSQP